MDAEARQRPTVVEKVAGGLSLLAAAIHGIATPAHFEEWVWYGLFFVFTTAGQAVLGIGLLTNAINARDYGPGWLAAKRRLLGLAIVANLAIVVLYVYTRTLGIPLGPEAGEVESLGLLDGLSKIAEAGVIVLLAVYLAQTRPKEQVRH